jgi:DNA-directed RNA polymerase specialized sigma24 family protein
LRREGHNEHDAQDLTEGFFELFPAKHYLKDVDREKGRFRSFLLTSIKHFLANEWKKSARQKRAGHADRILAVANRLRYRLAL